MVKGPITKSHVCSETLACECMHGLKPITACTESSNSTSFKLNIIVNNRQIEVLDIHPSGFLWKKFCEDGEKSPTLRIQSLLHEQKNGGHAVPLSVVRTLHRLGWDAKHTLAANSMTKNHPALVVRLLLLILHYYKTCNLLVDLVHSRHTGESKPH